ncbi:Hsp20/alpha crystallin family protein [Shewanella sp. HN-41]|uniref:Hsp20/alpha crystallin family protein n=1 Tax=Shewanella sp. HN-41 TaxID=327275 RepID=UPI0002125EAF|nr:Hsp20/alpha crystallin family protein [Shewanella sp. HN-41]EGM71433.1 heat shock protein Hsp20 [Shewanella sp. HN-41]
MNLFPTLGTGSQLSRWDPFNGMGSLYDSLFNGGSAFPMEVRWSPSMDVLENDQEILVKMDVPGMERKDLSVEIDDGALIIRGERKHEKEDKGDNYVRLERGYGSFLRSFHLPDYVDQGHIKAECKDGLLQVHLSKIPGKKKEVKTISIN